MGEVGLSGTEVRAELERRGLPSSKDTLSRCKAALFVPGELTPAPGGGGGVHLYSPEQLEMVAAAVELTHLKIVALASLKTLRLFAARLDKSEVELFDELLATARAQRSLDRGKRYVATEPMSRPAA